jgi:hypothetical protein
LAHLENFLDLAKSFLYFIAQFIIECVTFSSPNLTLRSPKKNGAKNPSERQDNKNLNFNLKI